MENVTEDDIHDIAARADYWGMESLTEDEQCLLKMYCDGKLCFEEIGHE